jgi:hypothetical protein
MWARVAGALAGIWLMASPSALGFAGATRVSDLIVGPLAASAAIIAASEVTRAVRWAGVPLGAWTIVAPWLLGGSSGAGLSGVITGAVLIAAALVPGSRSARFGGGWPSLWRAEDA